MKLAYGKETGKVSDCKETRKNEKASRVFERLKTRVALPVAAAVGIGALAFSLQNCTGQVSSDYIYIWPVGIIIKTNRSYGPKANYLI